MPRRQACWFSNAIENQRAGNAAYHIWEGMLWFSDFLGTKIVTADKLVAIGSHLRNSIDNK
jgi:hypothetical protein